jgi:hypothetical protein
MVLPFRGKGERMNTVYWYAPHWLKLADVLPFGPGCDLDGRVGGPYPVW